ncbi:Integrase, catalytic region [Salmonella enterica subsp. enterica serovar Gaminara str. A4-567]|nr:Integrase, catalytic region [Salmonella enterica subsp. enterica serovar Gaminara str. A4-567]
MGSVPDCNFAGAPLFQPCLLIVFVHKMMPQNNGNQGRTHQGKMCCGRTPMVTLLDGKRIWAEKNLSQM